MPGVWLGAGLSIDWMLSSALIDVGNTAGLEGALRAVAKPSWMPGFERGAQRAQPGRGTDARSSMIRSDIGLAAAPSPSVRRAQPSHLGGTAQVPARLACRPGYHHTKPGEGARNAHSWWWGG